MFDVLQLNVRLNINNDHTGMEIVKAGPSAVTAPEALLLHSIHSLGDNPEAYAIRNVIKVGERDVERHALMQELRQRYGSRVDDVFPRGGMLPKTLEDLELPDVCLGAVRAEPETTKPLTKEQKRKLLTEMGVELPDGNLSDSDLDALLAEAT